MASHTRYMPTRIAPGMTAPMNMSPTDTLRILPSSTSTTLGGMICPSVPDAAIVPVATWGL